MMRYRVIKPAALPSFRRREPGRRPPLLVVGRFLSDNQVKNSFVGAKSPDDMPVEWAYS